MNFRKIFAGVISAISLTAVGCGCGKKAEPPVLTGKPGGKVLVAVYSQSGTKNTKTVADWISGLAGGDKYEIVMKKPYSDGYFKVLKESKKHLDDGTLPEIEPFHGKIADYDVIFIGSPVWYGTFAPPVATFLKKNDFKGKTIVPFCTHGGGGVGKTFTDMEAAAPGAKFLPGLVMRGHNIVERTFGRGTADKCSQDEVILHLNKIFQ